MVCFRLTNVPCQFSLWSLLKSLLMGVTVNRAVPEGLTDTIILLCWVWTPISLYWGRICVTLHCGPQIFQPGAAPMLNPRGPPVSSLFSTAIARRFFDSGFSHTSKSFPCRKREVLLVYIFICHYPHWSFVMNAIKSLSGWSQTM